VQWSNGMDGVTKYPGQVTSAVCVKTKTSLIEFAAVLCKFTWEGRRRGGCLGRGKGKRKEERSDAINNISQLFA
jgi:hypothetical protein